MGTWARMSTCDGLTRETVQTSPGTDKQTRDSQGRKDHAATKMDHVEPQATPWMALTPKHGTKEVRPEERTDDTRLKMGKAKFTRSSPWPSNSTRKTLF